MVTIPVPQALGRQTRRRAETRAALAAVLWHPNGERRLPSQRQLSRAENACDPRDIWWVCETNSIAPVYLLPTREWIQELAALTRRLRARVVLEVAAGDGFLSRCLAAARPRLQVIATDDGSWSKLGARMSAADRREFKDVPVQGITLGPEVQRMDAVQAVRRYRPDLVLVSWAPPGDLVERLIKTPVKHVLEIGTDGDVCGNGANTWRFAGEFLAGPLESRAFCRLDVRPSVERHTRVTLYDGGQSAKSTSRVEICCVQSK